MDLGRVGVWSGRLQRRPTSEARELVQEWEGLGFGAVWVPESPGGRDVLTFSAVLLAATARIPIATGIAIIWARDPVAMMNAARTLSEAFDERFVAGVGISHKGTAVLRGHEYAKPLSAMRTYLEAMNDAPYDGFPPAVDPLKVVAALGPRMTELAGRLADGVHPFLSMPDHTAQSRSILGPDKLIAVEQGVVLSTDKATIRASARINLERFLRWPNYRNHFLRMGFDESDFAGGGSDRLVDALYAGGDVAAIKIRVDDHLAAGADHVCLQVIAGGVDEAGALRELAPAWS